ncbi:MAG: formate/nitrite transporter family protein [Ornithinimicrobium sp.]
MASSRDLSDDDVEEEVTGTFEHSVHEGSERLHRTTRVMLTTGFAGGVEIGFGVLAYLSVYAETGSSFLGAIAFSIGFAALYLAHSELFTEGFYYPIVAIFAGEGSVLQLLRLWGLTLLANLAGGWVLMWVVVTAFPILHATFEEKALSFVLAPLDWRTICLALLGGAAITLMTRMQAGSDSQVATLAAALAGAFLLIGLGLFHSILDSIIIFGALHSGAEQVTYLNWLAWFWYVAIANVVGGLLLVTVPRLVRSSQLVEKAS